MLTAPFDRAREPQRARNGDSRSRGNEKDVEAPRRYNGVRQRGRPLPTAPKSRNPGQYSSGKSTVVALRSASVMTQKRVPLSAT